MIRDSKIKKTNSHLFRTFVFITFNPLTLKINCKGKLIDLSTPKIMGILNVTPDSFYDGGEHNKTETALQKAAQMMQEGAHFIDIGGYSSRPDATDISVKEETQRVVPVIEALVDAFPDILISIDTFRASVAYSAIKAGAAFVNDISAGLLDDQMLQTVASLGVPYCMMHMRGTPQTMKSLTVYKNVTKEVMHYFSERIAAARSAGINDIVIDPGFGFAKTIPQNFELLSKLELVQELEVPVLVGLSRKSMIYKTLAITAQEALNGTTALHMVSLQKDAQILRVHDVKEAVQCIRLNSSLS